MRVVAIRKKRVGQFGYGKWVRKQRRYEQKRRWFKSGSKTLSVGEKKLRKVCKWLFRNQKLIYNNRKTLGGLEIDVYVPSLKIGFEFNGPQHYRFVKDFHKNRKGFEAQKRRDAIKNKLCQAHGIYLLTITDQSEKKIKAQITSFLKEYHRLKDRTSSSLVNYESNAKVEGFIQDI